MSNVQFEGRTADIELKVRSTSHRRCGNDQQVEQLRAENASLMARVQLLEAELESLRREISRNSSNSGKPPSSDTLSERAAQAEERLSRAERRRQAREKAKKFLREPVSRCPWQATWHYAHCTGPGGSPRPFGGLRAREVHRLCAELGSLRGGVQRKPPSI